jgi:hypothetical protein
MASFKTDVVTPDKHDSTTGFFRVVFPTILLLILVAFITYYYPMNGYKAPIFLGWPLVLLTAVILPIIFIYNWFHNMYQKKGTLALTDDTIHVHWNEPSRDWHFDVNKVSNLKVVYDGYPSFWGASKGTENCIEFKEANGEEHSFNFRLGSEEDASEMAKIMRTWYEKGISISEEDINGEDRFLMLYSARNKAKVLQAAKA